jgi:hypothetical protein
MGMIVIGAENLAEKLKAEPLRQHKALLNETGIVIFPASIQHATIKTHGISYEDDHKGNALAVIFDGQKFEIRYHRDFTEARVKLLVMELWKHPDLRALKEHSATYQGKQI